MCPLFRSFRRCPDFVVVPISSLSRFRCSRRCFRSVDVGAVAADDAAALLDSYGLRFGLNLVDHVGVSFLFPAAFEVKLFTMSVSRLFTIVGDSNVKNNMTPFNVRDRPGLSDAQVLSAGRVELLPDALRSVRTASEVVILSCITNYLTSSEDSSSVSGRVSPILAEFRQHIDAFCLTRASTMVLVAPPMYRVRPYWYNVGLPEILVEFSSVMSSNRPPNLRLLESFPTPEFQADGVHLTAYSGLRFVVHLFDSAKVLAEAPAVAPDLAQTNESVRVVADRVGVLEQDHARLAAALSFKTAVDAELDEFMENVRYEDHFTIAGLPGPTSGLSTRDWQTQVQGQIQDKLQLLLGRQPPIAYVQNVTGNRKDGIKVFLVKMVNLDDSKLIRTKFGSFFKAGGPVRHPGLIGLSVRNRMTLGTRVRIEIMKLLAERYKSSNPGAKTQVVNYESRPTMKFTPPSSASDRRPLHFNYIQAIKRLPVDFTLEELTPIYKMLASSTELAGKLRSTFVVLSDDTARQLSRQFATASSGPQLASAPSGSSVPAQPTAASSRGSRGGRSSRGRSESRMEHDRSRSRSPLRGNNGS